MFICEKNEETHIIHRRKEDDYALELEMRQLGRWGGGGRDTSVGYIS